MLNNNGPNIEPCAAPKIISNQEKLVLLTLVPIGILLFLCDKLLWTTFNASKLNPCALSFAIRSSSLRQSKALDKSVRKVPNFLPLSKAHFHFSYKAERQCCVLQPFRRALCCVDKKFSKKCDICANMVLSKTFDSIGRILSGP